MSKDWKRFELHATRQGETTCIALLGDFDLKGLAQLEDELQMAENRDRRATLDLRGLRFTDSTEWSDDDSLGRDLVA